MTMDPVDLDNALGRDAADFAPCELAIRSLTNT